MNNTLMTQLRQLKLGGMAEALQHQLSQPGTFDELGFVERLTLLLDAEQMSRRQHKQTRLIRQARFRLKACVQDIDYQTERNLTRSQISTLAQGLWIEQRQNLLITGPCGSGKTWLGCALGHSACLKSYSVRYYRLSRWFLELTRAKADGSYYKLLKQLAQTQVLILDDWGLETLTPAQRNDLLEVMDDRHDSASTVIISQLPTDQWYAGIGDNTLADAILDRLMHNAHRLELKLKGDSMRKRQGLEKSASVTA